MRGAVNDTHSALPDDFLEPVRSEALRFLRRRLRSGAGAEIVGEGGDPEAVSGSTLPRRVFFTCDDRSAQKRSSLASNESAGLAQQFLKGLLTGCCTCRCVRPAFPYRGR